MDNIVAKIAVRSAYGKPRIYPKDKYSKFIAAILMRETLLLEHIQIAQKFGWRFSISEETDQDYLVLQIKEGNNNE